MMKLLINDIFPILLAALLLYRAKPVHPLRAFYETYLDIVPCRSMRGFMAMFVIMHHLSQRITGGPIMGQFVYFGNLPVSVFFFLSGYGLMNQFTGHEDYAKHFLRRHLPPLLIPLLFVLLIFKLIYLPNGQYLSFAEMFRLILIGDFNMVIFWYMLVITLFYLAFGLAIKLFKNRARAVLLFMSLFCAAYICAGTYFGLGQWLFNCCHLFVAGMFWHVYSKPILSLIRRFYLPCLLGFGLTFLFTWLGFDRIFSLWPTAQMRLIISLIRNLAFTLAFILLTVKLSFSNPILDYLGRISLELYLIHPIFLLLLHSQFLYIGNDFIFCIAVIAATVAASALLSIPYRGFCRAYAKFIK